MYLKKSNIKSAEVKKVQEMLNFALLQPKYRGKWQHLDPDGYYGDKTESAVKAFQYYHNPRIQQTGVVGDQTFAALQNVGPYIYTTPTYTLADRMRTQSKIMWEDFYKSFRTRYEFFLSPIMETLLDETNVTLQSFLKKGTNKAAYTPLFRNLAKLCTQVMRIDKVKSNPEIIQIQKEIRKIDASDVSRKAYKISRRQAKIDKIISNIKKSTVMHPHELASRVSRFMNTAAVRAVRWSSVILDVCELVNHLMRPQNTPDEEHKTKKIFGKIIDDVILVFVTSLLGAAVGAALGTAAVPISLAIIISLVVAFLVDTVYKMLCENVGGDKNKPLSYAAYEYIINWIDTPQCKKMLEPREMYISAAPPTMVMTAAPPRLIIQTPR